MLFSVSSAFFCLRRIVLGKPLAECFDAVAFAYQANGLALGDDYA